MTKINKTRIHKTLRWLTINDYLWSVPLTFAAFLLFGKFGESVFGESFASYDPSFWQASLYAIGITVLFNGAAFLGLWFNFRSLYFYYLHDARTDFNSLSKLQKIFIALGTYLFFMIFFLILWLKLV